MIEPWTLYILHFAEPLAHAQHYIGIAKNSDQRLKNHKAGRGAKLVHAVHKAGIEITKHELQVFDSYTEAKTIEKRLKNIGRRFKYCPACNGGKKFEIPKTRRKRK